MPVDVPKPAVGDAGKGVMGQLTRKVGPLPLWAYAVIGGGAALAFKMVRGGGAAKGAAIPYVGPMASSGLPAAQGGSPSGGSTDGAAPPADYTHVMPRQTPTTANAQLPPIQQPSATPVAAVGQPIAPRVETPLTGPTPSRSGFPAGADIERFIITVGGVRTELPPMSVSPVGGLPTSYPAVVGSPSANTHSTPASPLTQATYTNGLGTFAAVTGTGGDPSAGAFMQNAKIRSAEERASDYATAQRVREEIGA